MNKKLAEFLAGITAFRIIYAIFLPVTPQEAYYWNYSRHPALSYFDHPPLAAYLIKLTSFFGDTNFSIHLAAILLSLLLSVAIYRLAEMIFDSKTAFWSVVAVNFAFIYALGGLIITPDGPMILFWVLSMIACFHIAAGKGTAWWPLLGIFTGAGFAGKYTMIFAWLGVFLFFLSSKERIKVFITPGPYIALAAAFVVMLPVLIWNYQHGWASFLFQTQRRAGEMTEFRLDFFLGFFGTLIGIYGLLPLPLLVAGMFNTMKQAIREKVSGQALLISFSLPLVIFLVPVSARSWVKMNWTAPAFIGWFIAGAAYYFKWSPIKRWVRIWGRISIAFLAVSFIVIHIIFLVPGIYIGKEDYSVGWRELSREIDALRRVIPEPYFICGYEYKTASLLAFYIPGHPETASNNVVGRPGLQYDFWANPDTLIGYNAIFVYDDRVKYDKPDDLKRFFEYVSPDEILTVKKGGKKLTEFHILRCYRYRGLKEGK